MPSIFSFVTEMLLVLTLFLWSQYCSGHGHFPLGIVDGIRVKAIGDGDISASGGHFIDVFHLEILPNPELLEE